MNGRAGCRDSLSDRWAAKKTARRCVLAKEEEDVSDSIRLRELQDYIRGKDHNPRARDAYFLKLVEEIGELADVIRNDRRMDGQLDIKGTIEEELYDVLYYVVALANVYDVDLDQSFRLKEELNVKKYGV